MADAASGRMGIGQLVREYVLPYNTLFALSGVTAVVLGLVSPWLVVGLGAFLLAFAAVVLLLDLALRSRLTAWTHAGVEAPGLLRRGARLLWETPGSSARGAALLWVILIVGLAVSVFGIKSLRDAGVFATLARTAPAVKPAAGFSIVVLPFSNMSKDPEQDYFADGLTEDVTTDLSRLEGSFVIARNTAFTYKGKPVDVRALGAELGVRYALEGSVQRVDQRVRVNVQLIDAASGAHVWADRFDSDLGDLAAMRDRITAQLANSVQVKVVDAEAQKLERGNPAKPELADLLMRAQAAANGQFSAKNNAAARQFYGQALELDPRNVRALAGLGMAHSLDALYGWSGSREASVAEARRNLELAAEIQPDREDIYIARCVMLLASGNRDEILHNAQRAVALNRNSATGHFMVGQGFLQSGQPARAIEFFDNALALSPHDPRRGTFLHGKGFASLYLRKYEDTVRWEKQAIEAGDRRWLPFATLAAAYAHLGKGTEASAALAEALKSNPRLSIKFAGVADGQMNPEVQAVRTATLIEGLRKAGLREQ